MSRYNWYNLKINDKIIGYGGALGQNNWRNNEIVMDFVTIFIENIENETSLKEIELEWEKHESGSNEGAGSRGFSEWAGSTMPPIIKDNRTILFRDVVFRRKECQ